MTKIQPAEQIKTMAIQALNDLKAIDITILPVSNLTSMTDYMIICSGTSDRHVKALANSVQIEAKKANFIVKAEGEKAGEWILLDLGDVIVHVMLPKTRAFYNLEGLWQSDPA